MRILFVLWFFSATCIADDSPIRMEWDASRRAALVTLRNDAPRPLLTQLRLSEWHQDSLGKDLYRESGELGDFPKIILLRPGEERTYRVGLRERLGNVERAYRLSLDGSAHRLPIFVSAPEARPHGMIEFAEVREGKLLVLVRNVGTRHLRVTEVSVRGAYGFTARTEGWYLLAGAERLHAFGVPAEACRGRLEVKVDTDTAVFGRTVQAMAEACD
jgi:fimbrial chaperone protein